MSKNLVRFDWALQSLLRHTADFAILNGFLSTLLQESIEVQQLLENTHSKDKKDANAADQGLGLLAKNSQNQPLQIQIHSITQPQYIATLLRNACEFMLHQISTDNASEWPSILLIYLVRTDHAEKDNSYLYYGEMDFCNLQCAEDVPSVPGTEGQPPMPLSTAFPKPYLVDIGRFEGEPQTALDEWIYYIKYATAPESFTAKGLLEVIQSFDLNELTPEEKAEYDAYLQASGLQEDIQPAFSPEAQDLAGEEKVELGIEMGKAEGIEISKAEIAKNMKDAGMDLSEIAALTKLTQEEIEKI